MGRRHRKVTTLVVALVIMGMAPAWARATLPAAPGTACVETPRPPASVPVLEAQRQAFGFHDEELMLCSPGAGDPTNIAARLWVPATCAPAGDCPGVVVVHGFGATKELTFSDMRDLVLRGMYVLSYDVRGQGLSGGQADLMGRDTIADEAHVLAWFHREVQPTKTGVYGISQGGAHAFMAAIFNCGSERAAHLDNPEISCDDGERWVDAVVPVQAPTNLEGDGTCSEFMAAASAESRGDPDVAQVATSCLFDGTPPDGLVEMVGVAISTGSLTTDLVVRDYLSRADRIDVPVYMATSYFDRLVPARNTTDMYERLRARSHDPDDGYHGTDVRMIISNDGHGNVGANFAVLDDLFTWLEAQLATDPAPPLRAAPVASVQEWEGNSFRLEHGWPIPTTQMLPLYLGPGPSGGGALTSEPPSAPSSATAENVPVVASPPEAPLVGAVVKPSTVGLLPGDSLVYDSAAATEVMEVTGLPMVDLWLSTPTGGFGQVNVSLAEVAPDGTAIEFARIRRGFTGLTPTPSRYRFPLSTTSWRIDPGNRLRLTITATDVLVATPSLANGGMGAHAGGSTPSFLELPLVDWDRMPPDGPVPSGASFTENPIAGICAGLGIPCPV